VPGLFANIGLLANAHDNVTRFEIAVNKVAGVDVLQAGELNTDISSLVIT
jgi:hypothetical protein